VSHISTKLFVARQAGEVVFISLDPVSTNEFDECSWRDLILPLTVEMERRDVVLVPAERVMWEGYQDDDSVQLVPHLHYTCPRCRQMHNVDLYDTDTNPRFACCDSCGWKSIAWLEWNGEAKK
jgi:hypothetical protein